MTGYSLHVGLNRVDPDAYGGWDGALSGCVNDAHSMQALAAAAGFSTTMLLDDQATSHAVIGEISLLAQQALAGDLCLVTYSGHGGQVDDVNGDDADAQDETWVCYDRQVVDDELAQMWSQFSTGVRVLVLSDSCHSGTVARERVALQYRRGFLESVRRAREVSEAVPAPRAYSLPQRRSALLGVGGGPRAAGTSDDAGVGGGTMTEDTATSGGATTDGTGPGAPAATHSNGDGPVAGGQAGVAGEPAPTAAVTEEVAQVADGLADAATVRPRTMPVPVQQADNQRRRGTYQFVQALSGARETRSPEAEVLLLSGCQDNQLSYDGPVNGQFTGRLLQVWAGGSFAGDYRAFHAAIVSGMPPDQTPNLFTEGVGTDFLSQKPFTITVSGGSGGGGGAGSVPMSRPELRMGDSGADVVHLQTRLTAHGQAVIADGQFGPGTDAAVRRFQSQAGLAADGVVGRATWAALDAAPTTPGAGGSAARPTIRRGATGEHVLHLQTRLSAAGYRVSVDGVFGPGTESAVRSFQRAQGLPADGVVGSATWAALG